MLSVGGASGVRKSTLVNALVEKYDSPFCGINMMSCMKDYKGLPTYRSHLESLGFLADNVDKDCVGNDACFVGANSLDCNIMENFSSKWTKGKSA